MVHLLAHEYAHIQQPEALQALEPGNPEATVLRISLGEGAAEFIAELISGGISEQWLTVWTKGREEEIGEAFLRDRDKTNLSAWLYNGYRVVRRYYFHASDKHAALEKIFNMNDPKAFLAASGWRPGL